MLIKGSVFKLILGGLFALGLSAAAAAVIYFGFIKPYAPTNLVVTITNVGGGSLENCAPFINFLDNSQNEDGFRVYRRNLGASTFALINILPASPGKGYLLGYTDSALPLGTYQYEVGAYNKFGESYSNIAQGTVVDSNTCTGIPTNDPSKLPLNPTIVSLSIINDCNVHISFNDNSTNEQGFKIYRFENGWSLFKILGPHTGIPDTYDDNTKLPVGTYGYEIVAYNQNGISASNSRLIDVTSVCNPAMKLLPTTAALALPTLQKLSGGTCNWVAAVNVYLRKGPNAAVFDRLVYVAAGQGFPIVGQSQDGLYWAVQVGPGVVGYITKSETYSLANGDCSIVPPLKDPVPPVVAPTPTNNSGGKHKATSTPCPVGAVCP
jgi:hypothetical protein